MFEKSKKTSIREGAYAGFIQAAVATAPNAAAVPIASGDYGYVTYVQNGASMRRRASEVMPGDIVQIRDAKFTNLDSTFDWYRKLSEEATVGTGVESKGVAGGSCLRTAASAKPQKLYAANVAATLGSTGGQFQEVGGWVERLLRGGGTGIRTAKASRKAAVVRRSLGRNKQENSRRLWSWWASSATTARVTIPRYNSGAKPGEPPAFKSTRVAPDQLSERIESHNVPWGHSFRDLMSAGHAPAGRAYRKPGVAQRRKSSGMRVRKSNCGERKCSRSSHAT